MVESPQTPPVQVEQTPPPKKTAWAEDRPKQDASYYTQLQDKYEEYVRGNEFIPIQEDLEETISLLTTDVKLGN